MLHEGDGHRFELVGLEPGDIDPTGWYSLGREYDQGGPWLVKPGSRVRPVGTMSEESTAHALDRAAPRALDWVRSWEGRDILAGLGRPDGSRR